MTHPRHAHTTARAAPARRAHDLEGSAGNAGKRGLDRLDELESYVQASQVVMLIHGSAVHVYEARGNHKALEYATLEELQRRALEAAIDANLPIVRIYEPGTDARHSQHRRGNDPSQSWRSSKGLSSRDESEVDDLEPMSSWTARTMARDGFISPHDPSLPGDLFAWAGGVGQDEAYA